VIFAGFRTKPPAHVEINDLRTTSRTLHITSQKKERKKEEEPQGSSPWPTRQPKTGATKKIEQKKGSLLIIVLAALDVSATSFCSWYIAYSRVTHGHGHCRGNPDRIRP